MNRILRKTAIRSIRYIVNAKFTCKINYLPASRGDAHRVIQMSRRRRLALGHKDIFMCAS